MSEPFGWLIYFGLLCIVYVAVDQVINAIKRIGSTASYGSDFSSSGSLTSTRLRHSLYSPMNPFSATGFRPTTQNSMSMNDPNNLNGWTNPNSPNYRFKHNHTPLSMNSINNLNGWTNPNSPNYQFKHNHTPLSMNSISNLNGWTNPNSPNYQFKHTSPFKHTSFTHTPFKR